MLNLLAVAAATAALLMMLIFSHTRATPEPVRILPETISVLPKGDRLPLPVLLEPEPAPEPIRPHTPPAPENLCTRHGGRKVETNGGRSWHCVYVQK